MSKLFSRLHNEASHLKRYLGIKGIIKDDFVPSPLFEDDIFLVSYPRSGNTWLRFLIANLQFPDDEIDYKNISDYIPAGAGRADLVWTKGENNKRPRFIKQHIQYHPKYPRVIYIARDGRDVSVSYFKFLEEKLEGNSTLYDFIQKQDLVYGSWSQNVTSWLNAELPPERFLLVKYEDLLSDTPHVLRHVADFSRTNWTSKDILAAVERASFDKMRKVEQNKGFPDQNDFSGTFVRSGKAGDWIKYYGEPEKTVFKRFHNSALVRLGYEKDLKW